MRFLLNTYNMCIYIYIYMYEYMYIICYIYKKFSYTHMFYNTHTHHIY